MGKIKPYTEAANPLTADIDICNCSEIVQKLKLCDEEMFQPDSSNQSIESLFSDGTIDSICSVVNHIQEYLKQNSPGFGIVMSGCGTSGRMAFLMARTYNKNQNRKKFSYTIAGGDKALFTSQEAPEDDHVTGRNDLIEASKNLRKVFYIGITCGLSAPYVAGQLQHCLEHKDVFTPLLLGFNPVSLARNLPISGWDKTFLDVARDMEEAVKRKEAFIVNPVLMGEAITGSSRMKGGSMTKIILDVIFNLATSSVTSVTASHCKDMLSHYFSSCKEFYRQASPFLSSLVNSAGTSLKSDQHLYYVASEECGVLGIIDATECTPTYGSDLNDVRGFIRGGYSRYDNNEGDISDLGENYQINVTDLASLLSPRDEKQAQNDRNTVVVVVTSSRDEILKELEEKAELGQSLTSMCKRKQCRVVCVCLIGEKSEKPILPKYLTDVITFRLPTISSTTLSMLSPDGRDRLSESLVEIWAKWTYNCASTGGHVLKGKVMKNFMVDLKVSNQKLFHRSIGIIQRFCPELSDEEAKKVLLCSIYEVDDVDVTLMSSPVSTHILVATPKNKVVPTAIVMSHKKCRFEEARNLLAQYHVIREALEKLTNH